MDSSESFNNQLLIAMPGMADSNFAASVTLVCEHNAEGALGIVINRPLGIDMAGLYEQLGVSLGNASISADPVLDGGPVARERGFVLHSGIEDYESTLKVADDLKLTLSRDVLDAMAAGSGPERTLVALGYAGWEAGQLEAEMLENTWLSVPASSELIFDVPFTERWRSAAGVLGIDISRLAPHAGHA